MKRTDLEKSIGNKITGKIQSNSEKAPFNKDIEKPVDKRQQRKLDQSLGLVPFAVKINYNLVQQIQDLAKERGTGINEVVTELIMKGLENIKS